MGIIATLLKLGRGKQEVKGNAPGKSTVMQGEGFDGQTILTEVYQAPGVVAIPPDGSRGVWVKLGGSNRYGVVLAVQNYQIEIDVGGAGGMAIHATSADGQTVKSKIVLSPDGKIVHTADGNEEITAAEVHLNGNGKRLVTWQELQTALTTLAGTLAAHVHPSNGTPSASLAGLSVDIEAAKTTTIKTGG